MIAWIVLGEPLFWAPPTRRITSRSTRKENVTVTVYQREHRDGEALQKALCTVLAGRTRFDQYKDTGSLADESRKRGS